MTLKYSTFSINTYFKVISWVECRSNMRSLERKQISKWWRLVMVFSSFMDRKKASWQIWGIEAWILSILLILQGKWSWNMLYIPDCHSRLVTLRNIAFIRTGIHAGWDVEFVCFVSLALLREEFTKIPRSVSDWPRVIILVQVICSPVN